ncbi:UBC-like protein [Thermothelomyces heterothallicus CBS 203.75]
MSTSNLPAVKRQHLLAEFAGLKQACPHGIFVSLTPGDPTLWSGVMFVRKGPYAPAILRFHISFPDAYPALPPLVAFSTDMFHPLITPLTTYMYSTDVQDGGTASANDDQRLPPGGFSLRHGFPGWFGRGRRAAAAAAAAAATATATDVAKAASSGSSGSSSGGGGDGDSTRGSGAKTEGDRDAVAGTPTRPVATATGTSAAASSVSAPGSYARTGTGSTKEVSTYEVLRYIRSTFDDEDVLDSIPLDAAGNPGAWHAWRTHRRHVAAKGPSGAGEISGREGGAQADKDPAPSPVAATGAAAAAAAAAAVAPAAAAATKRPDEWNWEGVWEERVKRNIASSLSEGVLYGHAGAPDEINFLNMDEAEVEGAKSNLLRTLGAAA